MQRKLSPLEKTWYKKLEDSGFKDIETTDDVFWGERKKKRRLTATYSTTYEYYRLAGFFLYDYKFRDERDRLIWHLHCEGKTLHSIARETKKVGYKVEKSTVDNVIKRLAKEMIKLYGDEV